MDQQFISRSIQIVRESDDTLPAISETDLHLWEGIFVQCLVYARDTVLAAEEWHQERTIPFNKSLKLHLMNDNGNSAFKIEWSSGGLPHSTILIDRNDYPGLVSAGLLLTSWGGSLQITSKAIEVKFGS